MEDESLQELYFEINILSIVKAINSRYEEIKGLELEIDEFKKQLKKYHINEVEFKKRNEIIDAIKNI